MPRNQPLPNIFYRIQNVDYGHYLEFPAVTDGDTAEGRVLKDSISQHWSFVAENSVRNTYRIINAAHPEESKDTRYALGVDVSDNFTTTDDQDKGKTLWTILIPDSEAYCTITTPNPAKPRTKGLLQMEKDGTTKIDEEKRRNYQKWKIIEVLPFVEPSPPLTRGTYRIRNIDGTSVLTVHSDALTLDPQEGGKHQAVRILQSISCLASSQSLLSGISSPKETHEIKKVDMDYYLSWQASDNGLYSVAIGQTPFTWIIRNLGGFVYSISPKHNGADLGLTAVNPETNQILLTPRETVRNQVWFIEPSRFKGEDGPDGHAKRFHEISHSFYKLQNIGNNKFATIFQGGDAIEWTTAGINPWWLQYENATSPYFTLMTHGLRNNYYANSGAEKVTASQVPSLWYLAKDGTNAGYLICPKGLDKHLVWSTETSGDEFLLEGRKPNTALQRWKIGAHL